MSDAAELSLAEQVDSICDQFERRFRTGDPQPIESLLADTREPLRTSLLKALVVLEVELREQRGEQPQVEEYAARFAAQKAAVHEAFADKQSILSSLKVNSVETSIAPESPRPSAVIGSQVIEQLGRFQILSVLGEGAFGTVYKARDPQLDRDVAIKVPRAGVLQTPDDRERFLREARAAAGLQHANICQVYEVGTLDGRDYIVMAFIDGKPLSKVQQSTKLSDRQIVIVVRKIALALQEAHEKGIIHRDLKPANIIVNRKGEPVVMDFGLARRENAGDAQISQSGQIMGTPAYMSPEQARGDGKVVGPAADIHSLGVIFYELLCGRRPYEGTITEVIGRILHVKPEPPSTHRKDVDPRLEKICLKAIAKKTADRYGSMKDFAAALAEILKEPGKATASEARPPTQTIPTSPAAVSEKQKNIQQFIQQGELPAALEALQGLAASPDQESAVWANEQAAKVKADIKKWEEQLPSLTALGHKLIRKCDFVEAKNILSQVPVSLRSAEIRDAIQEAEEKQEECDLLQFEIDEALRKERPKELPSLVKRFLQLKPGHKAMQKLADELKEYGAERAIKLRKGQRGGSTDGPLPWKWIAAAVGGLAALFAAVYFAVILFITANGTVQIIVESPEVVVSLENDKITVDDGSGKKFSLKPTEERTLKVEIDGVEFAPATKEITVEKNKKKVITAKLLPDKQLELVIDGEKVQFAVPDGSSIAATPRSSGGAISLPYFSFEEPDVRDADTPVGGNWFFEVGDQSTLSGWKVASSNHERNVGGVCDPGDFKYVGSGKNAKADSVPSPGLGHQVGYINVYDGYCSLTNVDPVARIAPQTTYVLNVAAGSSLDAPASGLVAIELLAGDETAVSMTLPLDETSRGKLKDFSLAYTTTDKDAAIGKDLRIRLRVVKPKEAGEFVQASFDNVRLTQSSATTLPTMSKGSPRRVEVKELNLTGYDTFPWLSADGRRIYFESKKPDNEPEKSMWIYVAERADANAPFGNKRALFSARHPTLTGDELEMVFIRGGPNAGSLRSAKRNSTNESFVSSGEIPELRGEPNPKSPMLYEDGLTLLFQRGNVDQNNIEMVYCMRPNRTSPWSKPIKANITPDPTWTEPITWPFQSRDELTLWYSHGGGKTPDIRIATRSDRKSPFANHQPVMVEGQPLIGRSPRFVAATGELFYSANLTENQGDWSLWVVKDYAPAALPSGQPGNDLARWQGRWQCVSENSWGKVIYENDKTGVGPVQVISGNSRELNKISRNDQTLTGTSSFRINDSVSPKTFDCDDFPYQGGKFRQSGVYEFVGERLRVVYRFAKNNPPARATWSDIGKADVHYYEFERFAPATKAIPADAATFNNHSFKFYPEVLSWTAAKKRCEELGGHLPIVDSKLKNDFLVEICKGKAAVQGQARFPSIWIGATDATKEGEWRWVDGSLVQFRNWQQGQPNNKQQQEHYATLRVDDGKNGEWCDQPDTALDNEQTVYFICEWDSLANGSSAAEPVWNELFNGKNLANWMDRDGKPAAWKVENGYMEVTPQTKDIVTRENFPLNFELHVEFWVPKDFGRSDQGRGNSGVYLHGRHEIQICDGYQNPISKPMTACGALYGAIAPSKNVCTAPETWQTFDITYQSPRVDGQQKITTKGRLTVIHNGTKIIDNAEFEKNGLLNQNENLGQPGPIMLQNHGTPVRFRSIRIRPLGATTAAANIPADAQSFNGHSYKFFPERLSWTEAKRKCEELGGHLPIVEDKTENDFLVKLCQGKFQKADPQKAWRIWLGATDAAKEGDWRWVNNSAVTFTNWFQGEPNNKDGVEHYVTCLLDNTINVPNGVWGDQRDDNPSEGHHIYFVCEWDNAGASGANIPADAAAFNGHSYKFFPEQLAWKAAKAKCEALGGHLIIVDSAEENAFAAKLVEAAKWEDAWIGATDDGMEGNWKTVKGDPLPYTNWYDQQPNNKPPGEHWALMSNRNFSGKRPGWKWSDQPNDSQQHKPGYLCEWDALPNAQAAANAGAGQDDLARWQGKWRLVALSDQAGDATADKVAQLKQSMLIEGNRRTVERTINAKLLPYSGTFRLNPAASPKEFDFDFEGPSAAGGQRGLYEFDGPRLRLIYRASNTEKPPRAKWTDRGTSNASWFEFEREEGGWTDLFNGKDLTGWKALPSKATKDAGRQWWAARPQDGILESLGEDHLDLQTERIFRNFTLQLEWRFTPGGKSIPNGSGIVVRSRGLTTAGPVAGLDPKGIEIDLRTNPASGNKMGTGCFIAYGTPLENASGKVDGVSERHLDRLKDPVMSPADGWNTCEITCDGDRITVSINGAKISEAWGAEGIAGNICLRNQKSAVQFRNIRIRELNAAASNSSSPELSALQTAVALGGRGDFVIDGKKTVIEGPQTQVPTTGNLTYAVLSFGGNQQVTDAGLAQLASLDVLQRLTLQKTRVTDAGMAHVGKLKGLQLLLLDDTSVGDAGLEQLAPLANLRHLTLSQTKVTDAGLSHLKNFPALIELRLLNTAVNGSGFTVLKELPKLEALEFGGSQADDAGLKHVGELTALTKLEFGRTKVTDAGISHLKRLTNLQDLYLYETAVTDESIPVFAEMKKLKLLNLKQTKVTQAGVERLKTMLPNCNIESGTN